MKVKLRMSGRHYAALRDHLYPGDGNEAVVFAVCGRRHGQENHVLFVRNLHPIAYASCPIRTPERVTWTTDALVPVLREAAQTGAAVVKFHSHPTGLARFSQTDDLSDQETLLAAQTWTDSNLPHASAVLLPDGTIFGRWMTPAEQLEPIHKIAVAGDDLRIWFAESVLGGETPAFAWRNAQAFGAGTTALLRHLSVAVVGCSGTGSPLIELLVRHGIGRLVLVDPDRIDSKNLNRITFARMRDVGRLKVDVAAEWIESLGLGTSVEVFPTNLFESTTVKRVAECDVVVGCMDGAEGRFLLNKIASFYCLPYFDVGIRLDADGQGGIDQICGSVNYLQPGGSSLLSRQVITMEQVQSEGLKRTNPEAYAAQVKEKYIRGVQEERPAVASVNMHYASLAVLELLARLHPYRVEGNELFAQFGSSLTDPRFEPIRSDGQPCPVISRHVGRGDTMPLLDSPYLSETDAA